MTDDVITIGTQMAQTLHVRECDIWVSCWKQMCLMDKGNLPCESESCRAQTGSASFGYLAGSLQNRGRRDWRDVVELTWK